jgi:hypothetical protein
MAILNLAAIFMFDFPHLGKIKNLSIRFRKLPYTDFTIFGHYPNSHAEHPFFRTLF